MYNKLLFNRRLMGIMYPVVMLAPLAAVLAAMGLAAPIASDEKGKWIGFLVIAAAAILGLGILMVRQKEKASGKLSEFCAETIVRPMFDEEFSELEISPCEKIGEGSVSTIFRKNQRSVFDSKYTDYELYSGSWLIRGEYHGSRFSFSNLTLMRKGSRNTNIKTLVGCFLVVHVKNEEMAAENFEKRFDWKNPWEDTIFVQRGKCFSLWQNNRLYVGLDNRYALFEPKGDQDEYMKKCTEDMALLKRMLDAAVPESAE